MRLYSVIGGVAIIAAVSTVAIAGQPERPGAFGRDRAQAAQSFQSGGTLNTGAPGASEVGQIVGDRGSANGSINRDYKATYGGAPTKGAPTR